MKLLSSLRFDQLQRLRDRMDTQTFAPGEYIVTEGAEGTHFYVIVKGSAGVRKLAPATAGAAAAAAPPTVDGGAAVDSERVEMELATLGELEAFGEAALIKKAPRNASIVALEETTCMCLDRPTFEAVLGPLQQLIDKEVARREGMSLRAKQPPPAWSDLEVRRLLGCGTFGRVRLVLHTPTGTSYALKGMRKQQIMEMKQQQNILNEKKILVQMDHPFILKLAACYQDAAEVYMLLELALGGELFSLLAKKAPLPAQRLGTLLCFPQQP